MSIRDFASDREPTKRPRYIVGIGASAGGLDALERFFDHLPKEDTGIAYVVVQHLSPDFRSVMDELLARHTDLPIRLVEDAMPVESGHIYLIPPKKDMIISGGRLLLSDRDRDRQQELSLPIDVFFRSLAQDCGPRAVAIVLSGGGSDGSRGILDVHEAGGLVMVQDDATAQFDGMPRTARDAGVASHVLAPEAMPAALLAHASREPRSGRTSGVVAMPPRGIEAIYRMLQESFGIDFTHYKPSTVTRRIERRIALARTEDIDQYVDRLRSQGDELDTLYRDLLIGVTRFFRNHDAFELLEKSVLPDLMKRAPRDRPFRAWVAGCATGEEAYSLAIAISEIMSTTGERPVKIFATDVHRGSLERAASGIFDEEALAGVDPERVARYFVRNGRTYQAVPELRQMIVFAHHNVIRDAPFTHVDIISCRNLLIYLQPAAQQKALALFHFALDRGGVLFLGPSESPGPMARDFESVDKHWRIYRKHSDSRTSVEKRLLPMRIPEPRLDGGAMAMPAARYSLSHLLGTYDALLAEHMPPSLLVNDRGELVHVFGGASKLLTPRDGRQGVSVLDVVGAELKMLLVGGLKRAMIDASPIVYRGVHLRADGEDKAYSIGIRRITPRGGGAPHLLVSFDAHEAPPPPRTQHEIEVSEISREQVGALEAELSSTKENLQAAIEELETSNEELQAANEELLASNEELQSTNEELQSVNEELYTVNAEYQRKIAELTVLTNDMDNLLSSTEVGAIFLDSQLRIRKFTPQVAQAFNLVAHDVGRPIETFAHNLDQPRLVEDLKRVLASGQRIERELRDLRGSPYFLRLLPYRAKGAVDGVVLTLIDMTGLKAAEDALFHERYLLDSLLGTVPDAIYFKDASGRVIRVNRAMADRFGIGDPRSAAGKTMFELTSRESALELFAPDEEVLRTGAPQHYKLEKRVRPDGREAWDLVTRLPLRDREGKIVGLIGIFRDVTEEKRAEANIQEGVRRRDQFLAMLSHELRNPLNAIVTSTELLKTRPPADKTDRMLAILERQSHQMSRLLDDLLEASRVTQNKIELKRRIVDVGSICRDAADAVRSLFDARGHSFSLEVSSEDMRVDGDPARLQQIHVNLLSNAAKYTPPGGTIVLCAVREEAWIVVRVRDSGVGAPKEMLDSIFDLFVQSRRTLDRSDGGLGLGLTIVRSLVAMHGGSVSAHSDGEGKGMEIVVRLPFAAHAVSEAPPPPPSRAPAGRRVLLVEDNQDGRAMLSELLTLDGFTCTSAESGHAALSLLAKECPDIALVDLGLPGMSGLDLARHVRADARFAHLYLIALTGYGQASDREAARAAGFDEHIVKPVSRARLAEILGVPASAE